MYKGWDYPQRIQLGIPRWELWIYNIFSLWEDADTAGLSSIYLLFILLGQMALKPSAYMQSHKNPKIEFYFVPQIRLQTDWVNGGLESKLILKAGIFWRQHVRSFLGHMWPTIEFSCFLWYHHIHSASWDGLGIDKTTTVSCCCCNYVITRDLQGTVTVFALLLEDY